jgi:hypothetical protein
MRRPGVAIALWIAFVVAAWNVVYDRQVTTAAVEFARDQVLAYQQGGTPASLHAGFLPRVRAAAWTATLWTAPLAAAGLLALWLGIWRKS